MKTACIYHSIDLDGWMSAAIVKHWFIESNNPDNYIINGTETARGGNPHNPNSINFIGYNYGQPIPDLSGYDIVIMCDISFPLINMLEIADRLMDTETLETNFIWLDHHISAIKSNISVEADGIRNTNFTACELTWKYFFPNEEMPEIVRLLGRYDCFGHKGTNEELRVLEFQYGARQCISNYEDAYNWLYNCVRQERLGTLENYIWQKGKSIYSYLCEEAKQTYKNGFEIKLSTEGQTHRACFIDLSKYPNKSIEYVPYKFICINKERFNPINFGIDYHKDGYDGCACFHYANGMWNFSIYNDNGNVDCSQIAKQYGGGGHKGAAGFKVFDINQILKYNV
jgi:uncharacterized protein